MNKKELRDYIRKFKRAMTKEEIAAKSEKLGELFLASDLYKQAKNIYGYLPYNQEVRTTAMLEQANAQAAEIANNAEVLVTAENNRVEEARRIAAEKIDQLLAQLGSCIKTLNLVKAVNAPASVNQTAYDYEEEPDEDPTAAMADAISASLENLVGSVEPQPPVAEVPIMFENLDKNFGSNYDPTAK